MKKYTVTFFGHRDFYYFFQEEEKLKKIIRNLCEENEYVEFLVGRNGEFDQFVSSTIRHLKRSIGDANSSHVLVLPYVTAEYLNNQENFDKYYDEIEICDDSSSCISIRTRFGCVFLRHRIVKILANASALAAFLPRTAAKTQHRKFYEPKSR